MNESETRGKQFEEYIYAAGRAMQETIGGGGGFDAGNARGRSQEEGITLLRVTKVG